MVVEKIVLVSCLKFQGEEVLPKVPLVTGMYCEGNM